MRGSWRHEPEPDVTGEQMYILAKEEKMQRPYIEKE